MFMEKIYLPRVTCDLFGATKGFEGSGCGSDKPRAANEAEARAYADFIRRKVGLPDLGNVQMERRPYPNGRGDFYYVGATFGQVLSGGGWEGEAGNRHYVPAQYEPGAFSVLFPGANQMRATVTMETLDDAGEVVSSQTMPVEPKKGGVVWSKDDVRKACGPVAKVKAARKAPTVAKRRATPTVDKRRRLTLKAMNLRAMLRDERAMSDARLAEIVELQRQLAEARQERAAPVSAPDAPATSPDAILSDLAAAEALMRGEGYVAPLPVTPEAAPTAIQCRKRTPAHERAIRRAWSERKAARAARFNVLLARDMAANNRRAAEFQRERADALAERVDALEYQSQQDRDAKRAADDACVTYRQRQGEAEDAQRLAEQEAREALAAREDMKRMLADAEARAAAAEAENAQLWAEIETLTAPVPALAA